MRECYKIVVLGCGAVGKSSLTVQFVDGTYLPEYRPVIEDTYRKQVDIEGQQCTLDIVDAAYTEQFTAMKDLYNNIKNGQGFLLVYSITSQSSFDYLLGLQKQILLWKDKESVPIVLVGNKRDLEAERVVGTEQGVKFARNFNGAFIETSAKANINVNAAFYDLVRQIRRKLNVAKPRVFTCYRTCVLT